MNNESACAGYAARHRLTLVFSIVILYSNADESF